MTKGQKLYKKTVTATTTYKQLATASQKQKFTMATFTFKQYFNVNALKPFITDLVHF
jgi:hypothetical protein